MKSHLYIYIYIPFLCCVQDTYQKSRCIIEYNICIYIYMYLHIELHHVNAQIRSMLPLISLQYLKLMHDVDMNIDYTHTHIVSPFNTPHRACFEANGYLSSVQNPCWWLMMRITRPNMLVIIMIQKENSLVNQYHGMKIDWKLTIQKKASWPTSPPDFDMASALVSKVTFLFFDQNSESNDFCPFCR